MSTSSVWLPLQDESLYVLPNCKSLWIKASAKWLNDKCKCKTVQNSSKQSSPIHCRASIAETHFSKPDEETNSSWSLMTWGGAFFSANYHFWVNYSFKLQPHEEQINHVLYMSLYIYEWVLVLHYFLCQCSIWYLWYLYSREWYNVDHFIKQIYIFW